MEGLQSYRGTRDCCLDLRSLSRQRPTEENIAEAWRRCENLRSLWVDTIIRKIWFV